VAVIFLYLILGTFMEELSMMISTIPITTPLMVQAGYDSVWYGILIVLLIQTAMISPPFGINLFVIHGIRGRGTLSDVEKGSAPFVISLAADDHLICIFPRSSWCCRASSGEVAVAFHSPRDDGEGEILWISAAR
jgi:TRAP-type C4-dicarboxylate transport system permease large subunit